MPFPFGLGGGGGGGGSSDAQVLICSMATAQSVPQNVDTKLDFESDVNTLGTFDNPTNRFTVTTDGVYHFDVMLATGCQANQVCEVKVFKNGSMDRVEKGRAAASDAEMSFDVSGILQLVAGDYIEIYLKHTNTVAQPMITDTARTYWNMHYIGA